MSLASCSCTWQCHRYRPGYPLKKWDPGDNVGRALHHIFPSLLIGMGGECAAGKVKRSVLQQVDVGIESAAIDDLEANVVQVDGCVSSVKLSGTKSRSSRVLRSPLPACATGCD